MHLSMSVYHTQKPMSIWWGKVFLQAPFYAPSGEKNLIFHIARGGRDAKRLPYTSPSIKSRGLQGITGNWGKKTMMHRLWRYDVFRFAQNDVARFTRNDAMFALMCPQAHIIRRSRHHWHSLHHLPKANIIEKRPSRNSTWSFFWLGY